LVPQVLFLLGAFFLVSWSGVLGQVGVFVESGLPKLASSRPRLTIRKNVRLVKINTSELLNGTGDSAIDEGVWDPDFQAWTPLASKIFRSVEGFWAYTLPSDGTSFPGAALSTVDVQYEMIGANGNPDVLSNLDQPTSEMDVVVEELEPILVRMDKKTWTMEGSINLHLWLTNAETAGDYAGTLVVVINHF
jgi:hypothetical protein